jgi:hypothetical protein
MVSPKVSAQARTQARPRLSLKLDSKTKAKIRKASQITKSHQQVALRILKLERTRKEETGNIREDDSLIY